MNGTLQVWLIATPFEQGYHLRLQGLILSLTEQRPAVLYYGCRANSVAKLASMSQWGIVPLHLPNPLPAAASLLVGFKPAHLDLVLPRY